MIGAESRRASVKNFFHLPVPYRRNQRNFYHESIGRSDERMIGRRQVAVAGDWHAGGGAVARRIRQDVEKII